MASALLDKRFHALWEIKHDHDIDTKLQKILSDEEQHDFYIELFRVVAEISMDATPDAISASDVEHVRELIHTLTVVYTNKPPSAPCADPGPVLSRRAVTPSDNEIRTETAERGFSAIVVYSLAPQGLPKEDKERIVELFEKWIPDEDPKSK
ncbi:hypothetical protein PSEUBRA_002874 [Kalmanozyma brasiliensis GHG001]|uniref:uncharacterized protein n=1 Tax=Kalmanozyma brasiliensis (strain GHG001) TaxID=1365824 RepID=UPI002867E8C2|nr:uncharacterized protein PSEUBRA_002874 [Kalmanozyma brasiliensis GHG001]KAF6767144.1 hypothetical protein PSEUBRA_002874 [Kalmanozyma brasiliensis GHG001]